LISVIETADVDLAAGLVAQRIVALPGDGLAAVQTTT
jgi:hypothetical protein